MRLSCMSIFIFASFGGANFFDWNTIPCKPCMTNSKSTATYSSGESSRVMSLVLSSYSSNRCLAFPNCKFSRLSPIKLDSYYSKRTACIMPCCVRCLEIMFWISDSTLKSDGLKASAAYLTSVNVAITSSLSYPMLCLKYLCKSTSAYYC